MLDRSMDNIKKMRENPDSTRTGVPTGIRGIDKIFNGFERGSYTIITGMIGGGKTTFMFNVAFNMAKKDFNVVYVSLEKTAELFGTRLHFLHAGVDFNRLRRGGKAPDGLPDNIYDVLKDAYRDLKEIQPKMDIIQHPKGAVNLSRILADIDKIRARKKVDVIVVDYLQAIAFEPPYHPTRPDLDLHSISQRLQSYGQVNKLVTITALQLKNQATKEIRSKSKKPGDDDDSNIARIETEHMAGSQMVIADADNGIGVVKDERDNPVTKVRIDIVKARDAEQGKIFYLDFNGSTGAITDPELEGQVKDVDAIVYSSGISEEKLLTDADLFSELIDKKDDNDKKDKDLDFEDQSKKDEDLGLTDNIVKQNEEKDSSSESEDLVEEKPKTTPDVYAGLF
jgi:replicative DNA helicase